MIDKESLIAKLFFGSAVRKRVYKKLAAQIKHDISLVYSLETMELRYRERKSPLAALFRRILQHLNEGQSLDVAISDFIPHEESMLLRGGVASGRLSETLELCAELITARQTIAKSVIEALAYPTLLFSLFIILLIVLSLYVVPQLATLSDPEQWEGAALVLYKVCSLVASASGIILLSVMILSIIVSICSLPYWTGKLRLRVEDLPPWSFYRLVVGSIWIFTVSTLMRAGIQIDHIFADMVEAQKISPWLAERVEAIRTEYALGKTFGLALLDAGYRFPDAELIEDLNVYSTLPGFDSRLHELADEWLAAGIEKIKAQARILNTGSICAMLALLCGLALGVTSLQQHLTNSLGGY